MPKHAYHKIYFHVIWSTKNREPLIDEQVESLLREIIEAKSQELGVELLEFGCTMDHLHLLLKLSPMHAPFKIIKDLKGNSSYFLNKRFVNDVLFRFEWQRGYGILSVSTKDLPIISQYVKNQKEHHQNSSDGIKLEKSGDE